MKKYCEYCHMDEDDFITPLEKNCHVYLYPVRGLWTLICKFKKKEYQININYCPMCGRKLRDMR